MVGLGFGGCGGNEIGFCKRGEESRGKSGGPPSVLCDYGVLRGPSGGARRDSGTGHRVWLPALCLHICVGVGTVLYSYSYENSNFVSCSCVRESIRVPLRCNALLLYAEAHHISLYVPTANARSQAQV